MLSRKKISVARHTTTAAKLRRLLEPIGNIPPAEAEARYYAVLDQMPLAAYLL